LELGAIRSEPSGVWAAEARHFAANQRPDLLAFDASGGAAAVFTKVSETRCFPRETNLNQGSVPGLAQTTLTRVFLVLINLLEHLGRIVAICPQICPILSPSRARMR
jgi:hypothetical protein